MPAALDIIDILSDDFPIIEVKDIFTKDMICMFQAIQNKSIFKGQNVNFENSWDSLIIPMGQAFSVYESVINLYPKVTRKDTNHYMRGYDKRIKTKNVHRDKNKLTKPLQNHYRHPPQ